MSLNLNPTPSAGGSSYHMSPAFNDAVNDSQLVRTFSIVALIGSILIFIGGAIAIGVGVAVIGLGGTRYWRVLGVAVIVLSALSFIIGPFRIIASSAMAGGVLWKGMEVLGTLAAEGKGDPEGPATRKRAITGIALSGVALAANAGWLVWIVLTLFVR